MCLYGFEHAGWMMGGWLGMLAMLAMWLLPLAFLLVALKVFASRSPTGAQTSALDTLDKAYASGKIGREEILQKRADLQAKSSGGQP